MLTQYLIILRLDGKMVLITKLFNNITDVHCYGGAW